MFTVKLWSFTKKVESTAQPSGSGTEYPCNILTPADITAPQIEITAGADLTGYNYAYISNFHRYYWIEEISFDKGIWQLALQCDVLATYKTEIGAQSLYVLRSSAAYDGTVVDNFYPTKASVTYTEELATPFYQADPYNNGFFVVNVTGVASGGTSTLWQMTPANFRSFINNLYVNIDGFQFSDIWDAIKKLIQGSPTKLVSSAMWFPAQIEFSKSPAQRVKVGNWDSGVDAQLITNPVYVDSSIWLDLHRHPQAATRGSYLNLSPYSFYTLTAPLFGSINLDSTLLIGSSQIQCYLRVDALSGVATLDVNTGGTNPKLAYLTSQLGVTMPLNGQSNGASIAGGIVSTLGSIAAAIASHGAAAPIIAAGTSGIGTAVTALSGTSFSTGSSGSVLNPTASWQLSSTHFTVADEDNSHNGRPYMKVATPSSLGGYMLIQKGDVPIPGTSVEAEQVRAFLEGGFFYE